MARLRIFVCASDTIAVKVKEELKQNGIQENKIKVRKNYSEVFISKNFPTELIWSGGVSSIVIEVEDSLD
ncbi:MAG TPA: hypothetical protein ACFYD4_11990 [Candidatus Wunengus sp. YC61]|uniref:hypothetical protein n=1 Tax=Candidatus Wunengus sp. YC61 TaxID=3367698 RepID=UPI00402842F4